MPTNTIPENRPQGGKFAVAGTIGGVPRGSSLICATLLSTLVAGCASLPWPDEPGVPVALSRAANVQAGDAFIAKLTAERRAANLPPPLLAPRQQDEIRVFAEDLQAGKLTAGEAQRAI